MARTNPKKEMGQRFADLRKRSPALDDKILEQFELHNINLMKSVFVILENEEGLRRAFEESGLDPANPVHWKTLTVLLAEVLLSPPGRPGAPILWTHDRRLQLLRDYNELKLKHPKHSQERIC